MLTRCPKCPGKHKCVGPSGPEGDILFIGEAPGRDEDRKGEVFIGKTGQEVNQHYLPLAGLRRDRVRFTNAIRCLPATSGHKLDPNKAADIELLESCSAHHLHPDIERGGYRLLVPMGTFACRAIFGEAYDLELRHGIPVDSPWGIPAFPMYHPALGIHEPKKMLYIRNDWEQLRRVLGHRYVAPTDPYAGVEDYQEVTSPTELLATVDPTVPMGMDTETKRGGAPFCLTYSQEPGTGRLIRAGRTDILQALNGLLQRWEAPILFHNYLYDYRPVGEMGLALPYRHIRDTMLLVYLLGNLPQGLKALAFRELGMTMEDFEDVVKPHSRENVLHYFRMATTEDWPKPEEELVLDDQGHYKLYKPQGMNTKLKRFWTDLGKNPAKDPFKMWEENWVDQQALIEGRIGPYPGMCITHAPFARVLHYACRDADATLRLWQLLRRMRRFVRKTEQSNWRGRAA